MEAPSIELGYENQHVLITGGSGLIGRVVVSHFLAAGANVSSLDIAPQPASNDAKLTPIFCDISSEVSIQSAFIQATKTYGPVGICIALGSLDLSILQPSSFVDADFNQLKRVLEVNVCGAWLTAREWLRGLQAATASPNFHPCLIIIGSESGHFGERTNAEYSLAKSAVQGGLLQSLKAEVPRVWRGARVNVVAPGPVETERWHQECQNHVDQYYVESQATTALGEPVPVKAVAMTILSLASHSFSSHVHGQVVNVDGGKMGKVMWSEEEGRGLHREREGR
ncbi:NAD(P)-binding protein [Decorospora gaudefroyi]|uniref:NAD(P)-binding protein n=1 Tax=Decorospora gaudefroyi TaxID=184978 RepID=A0A6A5KFP0_9PLEO|nr:NAD(P)-binding protein [Decorospora gaudefroyi]